jgi:IS30 family transposase
MANRLKMAKINAIRTLHEKGWSQRRIARELNVDRETVRRYVQSADSNPAIAPSGSDSTETPNSANAPPGRKRFFRFIHPAVRAAEATRYCRKLCS